ncbi:DUF4876 domain-containing protein [Pedobacter gandavensis]|uniref:DUF4876 domain-containing protein n=1 Tax=Pedobacter gandavensis TaxID=2679963 RepID=UPI00292CF9AC|nr:DUF4876 domain-containing protein [Pedobacter gandavensis]
MMKMTLRNLWIPLCALLLLNACKKDNTLQLNAVALTLTLQNPAELTEAKLSEVKVTFKEINSGKVTVSTEVKDQKMNISLSEGSYDVSLEGTVEYKLNGETKRRKVGGLKQGLVLTGTQHVENLAMFTVLEGKGFVIQEIFFTGTQTAQNKPYTGDKYFVIFNNSAETLYADGLVIAQSDFLTTMKRAYTPDVMSQAVAVGAVIRIPGSGKDHPVLPGKSIVIADDGINHKEFNPVSVDLTKADFEIFTPNREDVDNPQVKNMENVYSRMVFHDRGFSSYVLAHFPDGTDDFLLNQKYDYSYSLLVNGVVYPMDQEEYKIPNSWIIDAVNLSVQSEFQWIVTDPSLDMGWTFCGKIASDKTRYGKSVRRKVLSTTPEGRVILKDTNNSSLDFDAEAKPSLM